MNIWWLAKQNEIHPSIQVFVNQKTKKPNNQKTICYNRVFALNTTLPQYIVDEDFMVRSFFGTSS